MEMNFYSNEKVNLTGMIVFEVMLTTLVVIVNLHWRDFVVNHLTDFPLNLIDRTNYLPFTL